MTDSNRIQSRIQGELDNLTSSLDGNSEKVAEIVAHFIKETPIQFQKIKEAISQHKWREVAALIHKIKIRYNYLGLDDISAHLSTWENELSYSPDKKVHDQYWADFVAISDVIMEAVKGTTYYWKDNAELISSPLKGKRILVAEDDRVNGMVFELFIQEMGGVALRAYDGYEAVKMALEEFPDLIFMDVHMPHFSGLDAIKELRAINFSCPIVSLSASTRLYEREGSLAAGANEFLVKPANRQVIQKTLIKYLVTFDKDSL